MIGSLKGVQIVEAGRNGTKGMCCGAGGARMFMEEDIGTKINDERSLELIETGASRVATACPFCYVMMDDGVKGHGKEENDVRVADIAQHLLEAIEAGEAKAASSTVGDHFEIADRAQVLAVSTTAVATKPTTKLLAASIGDVTPDDLKVISGVGPKLEAMLHEIGIVTYEQIASFDKNYADGLSEFLAFPGRIQRDNWSEQAVELAKGRSAKPAHLPPLPTETPDAATNPDS